jgi:dihydroflavonol-4-reductase
VRYLVTGATGFLGAHVVDALHDMGHEAVRYARSTGGDVLDEARVRREAVGCDGVFHCAGLVSRKPDDAEALYRVHVEGTRIVLDACAAAGVRRAVVASTSGIVAVGEDPEHVATETDPTPFGLIGRWPYYRSKLFAENVALGRNRRGFEVVAVNPSLLLGPGDERGSSTGDVRNFLEGGIPAVFAGGLSFVDVRDAAVAMRLAMERGRPGERYLVGGCNITLREFFQRLSRISGVPAPWLPLPGSRTWVKVAASWIDRAAARLGVPAPVDPVTAELAQCFWYLDSTKANVELGWRPRDPNVTLHDTVADLRLRGVVWPRDPGVGAAAMRLE